MDKMKKYEELNSLYKSLVEELKELEMQADEKKKEIREVLKLKKKKEIQIVVKQIGRLSDERLD